MKQRLNASTPSAKRMGDLLGHASYEGVEFTRDQYRALLRLYGFSLNQDQAVAETKACYDANVAATVETNNNRKSYDREIPLPPPFDEVGVRRLYEDGAGRNMFRHAKHDGMRVMAYLSRALSPGEDPVKLIVQLLADAGHDVDPEDSAWAFGMDGEEDPQPAADE